MNSEQRGLRGDQKAPGELEPTVTRRLEPTVPRKSLNVLPPKFWARGACHRCVCVARRVRSLPAQARERRPDVDVFVGAHAPASHLSQRHLPAVEDLAVVRVRDGRFVDLEAALRHGLRLVRALIVAPGTEQTERLSQHDTQIARLHLREAVQHRSEVLEQLVEVVERREVLAVDRVQLLDELGAVQRI